MSKVKLTKQGVRDLSSIPGKSLGRKYVAPPAEAVVCHHKGSIRRTETGESICLSCGQIWDYQGRPVQGY